MSVKAPAGTVNHHSDAMGTWRDPSGGALERLGPPGLSDWYDHDTHASIDSIEWYHTFSGTSRALISINDDIRWVMGFDDGGADDTYSFYEGMGEYDTNPNWVTLNDLHHAATHIYDSYYMFLKRMCIVPVSLPRTLTNTSQVTGEVPEADKPKKLGFLDHTKYFRFVSSAHYYGAHFGETSGGGEKIPNWETRDHAPEIHWTHIGRVITGQGSSTAGSWKKLRMSYYPNNRAEWDHAHDRMIYNSTTTNTSTSWLTTWSASDWVYPQMGSAKPMIKWRTTSVTAPGFKSSPGIGSPTITDIESVTYHNGADAFFIQTDTEYGPKGIEQGFDSFGCTFVGAYLQEYAGAMAPKDMLIASHIAAVSGQTYDSSGTEVSGVDALDAEVEDEFRAGLLVDLTGETHDFTSGDAITSDMQARLYTAWIEPTVEETGFWAGIFDKEFEQAASFSLPGTTTALKMRFETDEWSLSRATAYLDFYTGYMYEKIEISPLPREYKTKMQATPRIHPNLTTAVVGISDPSTTGASTPTATTAGTTYSMGSTPDGSSY